MAGKAQNFTQRQHMLRPGYEIFRYCDSELGEVSLHHHDFYEIYLFLNGSVEYSIESRIYRLLPGDILLIGPMELHQPRIAKDHGPYERMVLWLDKRYLEQLSTPQTSLTRCFDASAPGHTNLLRLPPAQRAESTSPLTTGPRTSREPHPGPQARRSSTPSSWGPSSWNRLSSKLIPPPTFPAGPAQRAAARPA